MKKYRYLLFSLFTIFPFISQGQTQTLVSTDIDNYWQAYDKIITVKDSMERIRLINELYISKATTGLKGLMTVRRYKDYEFVNNMIKYQGYWNSIRANTQNAKTIGVQIDSNIKKLKEWYPDMKPAKAYLSIGAFRSPGTYFENNVLLGGEYLFAQQSSFIEELPARVQKAIKDYAPLDIPLMATHEYVHTQQKSWEDGNILIRCMAEGVAEFISRLVTEKPLSPAVKFGKANEQKVLEVFMREVVSNKDADNWLWIENKNELKVNDLGYYIGYEICERYYKQAKDKKKALKELIELDYSNEKEFERIVNGSNFLPMTIKEISEKYELSKPKIKKLVEFKNGSQKVSPKLKTITLVFEDEMDKCCRSFDNGPDSTATQLRVTKVIGWSTDKKSFTFEINELKPNTKYEIVISNFAKATNENRLAPYLIKFKTGKK